MPPASTIRLQIEAVLADRIPSALTPAPRIIRAVAPTGIRPVDNLLEGGLPLGAITEIVGSECSGRTSFALSFIAHMTRTNKVCAWVDVSDALHPESAAAIGVDLSRLLWVQCGVSLPSSQQPSLQNDFALPQKYFVPPPIKKGLHGGGFGPHPRGEAKGLSDAVSGFLRAKVAAPQFSEPHSSVRATKEVFGCTSPQSEMNNRRPMATRKPWSRIEQALRVTDLLLQAGGFSAIVLDMGGIAPEFASRVPLATWFRYRSAAERSQACILLLTQHACAKSSAGLVLRLQAGNVRQEEMTVFTGVEHRVEVVRERFTPAPTNVIPLRKQSQSERGASWQSRTTWAGRG